MQQLRWLNYMPNETLKQRSIFNELGSDRAEDRELVGGNSTGINNLNSVRYTWAPRLYKIMMNNFWIPEKTSLVDDKSTIKSLTDNELVAFKNTISFLIALDSMQTSNLPNLARYVTAPEVAAIYTIQEFQELVHSQSYQYILQELFSSLDREEIYNYWRNNPLLLKRNKHIASMYESFNNDPTLKNFKQALVADFILESMYFYHGFQFFYQLESRNKGVGVAKIISYIENDEVTHVSFMKYQIAELFDLTPGSEDSEMLRLAIMQATEHEIEWAQSVYGDRILGMSNKSAEEYCKFLANMRGKLVGLPIIYRGFNKNPYAHLDKEGEDKRENFFETTVTSYSQSTAVEGWDDF